MSLGADPGVLAVTVPPRARLTLPTFPHAFGVVMPHACSRGTQGPQTTVLVAPQLSVPVHRSHAAPRRVQNAASLSGAQPPVAAASSRHVWLVPAWQVQVLTVVPSTVIPPNTSTQSPLDA